MKETVLQKIVYDKINWIKSRKQKEPLTNFRHKINTETRNFYDSLKTKKPSFILEIKKKSPSLGVIRKNFNLIKIAAIYKKYASSISVLTEEKYFDGNLEFINIVRENTHQPILCKDFFIDPYQVYLARYYNADAILLMLSILDDRQYLEMSKIAKKLKMDVLTEVNNIEEIHRAIKLKSLIIGINNRNLHDLSIDFNRTRMLSKFIKKDAIIISESGIEKYYQIKELSKFVNGFLIGSNLMSKKNLDISIRSIILGDNKVCGLTLRNDIKIAEKYGAIYGGLIFIKTSCRNINIKTAKKIILNSTLRHIGVFQNATISTIVKIATELDLYAVQLHGQENQKYIDQLRNTLPKNIKIWKAFSIKLKLPKLNWNNVSTYIFDSCYGGSNTSFNWSLLKNQILDNVILAGGINTDNCVIASQLNCAGLDLNSGIEKSPGIKDYNKIKLVFKKLRYF